MTIHGRILLDDIVVLITASDEEEASKIARAIVEEKLAGCINIIKDVRSIYSWQGKIEDEKEVLMVVKTRKPIFDSLMKRVKELHSYTVPEIIALPIIQGPEDYLKWLKEVIE
jgi:periplasmic divalent cation tolerance protein